jgi:predicted nucleic acid-binding Zn ribbon protein
MSPRWTPLPGDKEPRKIGDALDRVVPGGRAFTQLLEQWDGLVGDALAARTRPTGLHAGTLVIAVDDPAWAAQLRYLQADLLTRLQEAMGAASVTEIRVVVRPSRST